MPKKRITKTKEEHYEQLKKIAEKFAKENDRSPLEITSMYYRLNAGSEFSRSWEYIWTKFEDFRIEVFGDKLKSKDFALEKKIAVLEDENKKLKNDNTELLKLAVSTESIMDLYKSQKLPDFSNIKLTIPTKKSSNNKQEAVLVLSDFHCGEVIKPEEVNNINQYNVEIMKKRIDKIFYYALYYCKKFEIDKIHLLFLGDLMSGSIHPELVRTNELNDVEALFLLQSLITEKILSIESQFKKISCEFLVGNHTRISDGNNGTKLQWKSSSVVNWEYVLGKQIQLYFDLVQKNNKEKKIDINISNSLFKVKDIAGRKFLITHGHMLSGGSNSFAGIPYYGLSMSSAKLFGALYTIDDIEQEFQDIIIGHLHTSARVKITTGSLYINGSLIGTGEYGLYKMKAVSEPEQLLLIVQDGKVNNEIILRGN